MAEERDIEQNIILNYQTNAQKAAKDVDNLNSSYEAVNAEKKQGIEVNKKEEQAYKSMKAQIKEATIEYQKLAQTYGVTSKEALNAAQNVARLKDELDETKDFSDAFNPDQKMTALATSAKVAGIGLQGVTSGMALFGDINEDTEKQLLKVQAAMAFSDSIAGIFDMAGEIGKLEAQAKAMWVGLTTAKTAETTANEINTASKAKNIAVTEGGAVATGVLTGATTFQTIATTGATIATNLFNASLAILTAPITLLILGIAGLVAGIGYLTGAFGDFDGSAAKAEQANKKLSKEIDDMAKATEKSNEQMEMANDHAIEMAKASGKSAVEVRKLKEELINQEVAEKRLNAVKAYSIYLEAQRIAGLEDATDAQKETAKKATELYKDQNATYNASLKERKQMALNHRVEIVAEEKAKEDEILKKQQEAQKKRAEDLKKANEEAKKKREDEQKAILELEKKYVSEIQGLEATTEQQKLDLQKQTAQKELDALNTNAKQKQVLQLLLNDKFIILQKQLDEKNANDQKEKLKELLDSKAITEQEYSDAQTLAEVEAIKTREQAKLDAQEEADIKKAESLGASLEEIAKIKAFYNEKEVENTKNAADKEIEIQKSIEAQKQAIQDSQINLAEKAVGFLSIIAGKNKALQKAAIIAENAISIGKSIISTNAANIQATAQGAALAIPTSGASVAAAAGIVTANTAALGLSIASSVAATAKALSALGGGSAGGGGSQASATPSGGSAPQVGFQSSSENQIATSVATSQQGTPPIQAYVVSTEVTNSQTLDRNRIASNSF
jgi:hypothetical protein